MSKLIRYKKGSVVGDIIENLYPRRLIEDQGVGLGDLNFTGAPLVKNTSQELLPLFLAVISYRKLSSKEKGRENTVTQDYTP